MSLNSSLFHIIKSDFVIYLHLLIIEFLLKNTLTNKILNNKGNNIPQEQDNKTKKEFETTVDFDSSSSISYRWMTFRFQPMPYYSVHFRESRGYDRSAPWDLRRCFHYWILDVKAFLWVPFIYNFVLYSYKILIIINNTTGYYQLCFQRCPV